MSTQAVDRRAQCISLAQVSHWVEQAGGEEEKSGLNQVITKSCSFEKEEARAQEFVLNPLKVLHFKNPREYN